MEQKQFYYCYSPVLFDFLKNQKRIQFICTGNHIDTGKQFWLFWRTDKLNEGLKEFSKRKKSLKN